MHDSYLIGVQYVHSGHTGGNPHRIDPKLSELRVRYMVTSIQDDIVELIFSSLVEWQIKDNQWEIAETAVVFCEKDCIIWSDNAFTNDDELKEGSYVIAKSMKWRIVE